MIKTVDLTWDHLKINGDTVLYPSTVPAFGVHFLINQFEGVEIVKLTFEKEYKKYKKIPCCGGHISRPGEFEDWLNSK